MLSCARTNDHFCPSVTSGLQSTRMNAWFSSLIPLAWSRETMTNTFQMARKPWVQSLWHELSSGHGNNFDEELNGWRNCLKKICTAPGFGRFQLVHATLDHPEGWGYILDRFTAETNFEYQHFAICFVGHTHIPVAFEKYEGIKGGLFSGTLQLERNKKYLVNVGSVGQPRDGNPQAAFVEFAPAEMKVTLHRVDYDIEATCKKILSADLPPRLAERLAVGR